MRAKFVVVVSPNSCSAACMIEGFKVPKRRSKSAENPRQKRTRTFHSRKIPKSKGPLRDAVRPREQAGSMSFSIASRDVHIFGNGGGEPDDSEVGLLWMTAIEQYLEDAPAGNLMNEEFKSRRTLDEYGYAARLSLGWPTRSPL